MIYWSHDFFPSFVSAIIFFIHCIPNYVKVYGRWRWRWKGSGREGENVEDDIEEESGREVVIEVEFEAEAEYKVEYKEYKEGEGECEVKGEGEGEGEGAPPVLIRERSGQVRRRSRNCVLHQSRVHFLAFKKKNSVCGSRNGGILFFRLCRGR